MTNNEESVTVENPQQSAVQTKESKKSKNNDDIYSKKTVFVTGIPLEMSDDEFEQFFSAIGPMRRCFIVKREKKSIGCGYVTFITEEDTQSALKIKDFKVKLAVKRNVTREKKAQQESEPIPKEKKVVMKEKRIPKRPKNSKTVLISGLPELTKQVIYKKVRKFGTISNLEVEGTTARVEYATFEEAKIAMEKLNNHTYKGVTITCELVMKEKYRLIIRNLSFQVSEKHLRKVFESYGKIIDISLPKKDNKVRGFAFVEYESKEHGEHALTVNGTKILGRVVAVDWALNKTEYNRLADVNDEEDEEENVVEEQLEDDEPEIIDDDEYDENIQEELEAEEECTIFVRNLSFDTTAKDLKALFSNFGDIRYALITKDKVTGMSKGNGFVCFIESGGVRKALDAYEESLKFKDLDLDPIETDSNPKSILERIVPKVQEKGRQSLYLNGRYIVVMEAVSKKIADKITHRSEMERRHRDKRNLYLLKEGVIFPQTEAAETYGEERSQKSMESYGKRKRLLETNPNLFISRTRLSVRGMPQSLTDKILKTAARDAVTKFWKDVEAKTRPGLEDEVIEEEIAKGLETPSPKRKVVVKQAKIIRDATRKTADGFKSKGYGFVEFTSHADALACLRVLNNTPAANLLKKKTEEVTGKQKILFVEFAVENKLVVGKREQVLRQQREKLENENSEGKKTEKKESNRKKRPRDSETPTPNKKVKSLGNKQKKVKDTGESPLEVKNTKFEKKNKLQASQKINPKEMKFNELNSRPSEKEQLKLLKKKARVDTVKAQKKERKHADERRFDSMVAKIKGRVTETPKVAKSKWYE